MPQQYGANTKQQQDMKKYKEGQSALSTTSKQTPHRDV